MWFIRWNEGERHLIKTEFESWSCFQHCIYLLIALYKLCSNLVGRLVPADCRENTSSQTLRTPFWNLSGHRMNWRYNQPTEDKWKLTHRTPLCLHRKQNFVVMTTAVTKQKRKRKRKHLVAVSVGPWRNQVLATAGKKTNPLISNKAKNLSR